MVMSTSVKEEGRRQSTVVDLDDTVTRMTLWDRVAIGESCLSLEYKPLNVLEQNPMIVLVSMCHYWHRTNSPGSQFGVLNTSQNMCVIFDSILSCERRVVGHATLVVTIYNIDIIPDSQHGI